MRATLDLAAFDADDLTCRHLDRLVGWRDGTGWRLQWAGVNAFPNDLQDRGIAAGKLADECGFGVGEGARPALPCLDDLTGGSLHSMLTFRADELQFFRRHGLIDSTLGFRHRLSFGRRLPGRGLPLQGKSPFP